VSGGRVATPQRVAGVVALACAAQFLVVLDVSVVNVALPSVQAALHVEPAHVQWVVHAYTLVLALPRLERRE
jgi:MFS family permease